MSLYGFFVLIHVLSAVIGMGPTFAFPIIQSFGTTKENMLFINKIMEKIEKVVTIGSISLLISGLVMGALNTYWFTQGWYITSLALYFVAHYLAVGYSGKKTKRVAEILVTHEGNDIPSDVVVLNKATAKAGIASSIIAVIMIFLMSVKPF